MPSPSGTQLSPLVLTPHLCAGLMNAVASRLSFRSIHEANSEDLRNCAARVVASASRVISEISAREITQ